MNNNRRGSEEQLRVGILADEKGVLNSTKVPLFPGCDCTGLFQGTLMKTLLLCYY